MTAFAGNAATTPCCLRSTGVRDILVVARGAGSGEEVNRPVHMSWRCRSVEVMTDLAGACRGNILNGRRTVRLSGAV